MSLICDGDFLVDIGFFSQSGPKLPFFTRFLSNGRFSSLVR
jgi:hypothetical protein